MKKLFKKIIKCTFFFVPYGLIEAIVFETKAYFSSRYSSYLKLDSSTVNNLNIGSGSNTVSGFINIDFYGVPNVDFAADLRRPLKIHDECVDGIFSEHTLEHLSYAECDRLLGECYRIMKNDSTIRIIVPDLSIFIKNYSLKNSQWFNHWEYLMFTSSGDYERSRRYLNTPMESISFVTQEYGHVSAWDAETLAYYLNKNGFRNIVQAKFKDGRDPLLLIDQNCEARKYVSLYMEASK